ncbi:hypothetical protein FsymDg_2022 [Candidatus Protofrankia datiscae]|uniref:Uncharacterized protein n=1 Tax=Candidatus Protofrankia datiscae TaxID=2716812 RepID=F8B4B6_9ACTN|nr:hypothetical protein FsymDg_2022 [Candidatus Protofrankia datiscae]
MARKPAARETVPASPTDPESSPPADRHARAARQGSVDRLVDLATEPVRRRSITLGEGDTRPNHSPGPPLEVIPVSRQWYSNTQPDAALKKAVRASTFALRRTGVFRAGSQEDHAIYSLTSSDPARFPIEEGHRFNGRPVH